MRPAWWMTVGMRVAKTQAMTMGQAAMGLRGKKKMEKLVEWKGDRESDTHLSSTAHPVYYTYSVLASHSCKCRIGPYHHSHSTPNRHCSMHRRSDHSVSRPSHRYDAHPANDDGSPTLIRHDSMSRTSSIVNRNSYNRYYHSRLTY